VSRFLLICFGGALGTGARFLISTWAARTLGTFPYGTIFINISGSFFIALVMELALTTGAISDTTRLFVATGIMGGYTTYSSFNYDTLRLASGGSYPLAGFNLGITVVGCLLAGYLGLIAARLIARVGFAR
jgi:fluoride exporter